MKAVAGAGTGRIPCCTMHMPAARANGGGGNAFRCEHFDQRAAGNNICNGIKRTDLVKMHKLNGNAVGMTLRFCNQFVNSKGMLLHCIGHGQRTDNVFNFVQPAVRMVMLVFMTVLVLMAMLMRVFMLMFMIMFVLMTMLVFMLMAMLMFVKVFVFVYAGGIFVRIGVHVFNGKMNSANAAFFGGSAANIQSDGREGSCNILKLGTLFFGKQIIKCARKHIARRTQFRRSR